MANFAFVRPFGIWNALTVVLHGEMQQLDQNLFKAPNFADGGTYAPASVITVGGAGMTFTGPVTTGVLVADFLLVDSLATFNCPAIFNQAMTANGSVSLGDTAADTLLVNASTQFNNNVVFGLSGTALLAFESPTVFNRGVSFSSNVSVAGTLGVSGTLSCFGDLNLVGGTIVERITVGSTASTTYSVSNWDVVLIPNTLSGTGTVYTLDHVGAAIGKKIRFALQAGASGSAILNVVDIVTGNVGVISNQAGFDTTVDLQFISGSWFKVAHSPGPF